MSKFNVSTMRCNVCGRENEVTILTQAQSKGTADLDFRPAEVKRSAMPLWIKKCDYCRNVFSVTDPMPDVPEKYVDSKEYINCGGIAGLPDLAKKYVRIALIYRKGGEYKRAGDAYLCAAWACDDEKLDVTASTCRKKALECYNEVNGKKLSKRELSELMLRILDMLRRSGMFEEAIAFSRELDFDNEQYFKMCKFGREKAEAKDKACYRISDI
ncbi:MAG TPA: hypothetical protein DCG85_07095 [Lachnospiraceae bacterium]|nr:hypothetical protein [Lachnospiraceae bacterium]